MPTSEARILANQANAARSTGPKTPEGKASSRQNALKHGLTGDGVVLLAEDAIEVERRTAAMTDELRPSGELGRALVRRMATLSVRLERCFVQETTALTERVRQAEADFEAPEGIDETQAARLRAEAGRIAMFDPSKEATLARRYESAAERGLFRALKEFRQVEKEAKAAGTTPEASPARPALGSFLPAESMKSVLDSLPAATPPAPARIAPAPLVSTARSSFDLPISVGRAR